MQHAGRDFRPLTMTTLVTGLLRASCPTRPNTLKACVDLCHSEEAANQTGSCLPSASQAHNGSSVNAVKSTYQKRKQAGGRSTPAAAKGSGPSRKSTSHDASTKKCPNCGRSAHTKNPCPAADRKCPACHWIGHFLSMCPSSGKKTVGVLKLQQTTLSRDSHTVHLDTQLLSAFHPTSIKWLPDTGSDIDAFGLKNQLSFLSDFPENLKADTDIVRAAN